MINETAVICGRFLRPLCKAVKMHVILFFNKTNKRGGGGGEGKGREGRCVCVCVCVCVCKCNVCECYSAVLVIRLTYTSTKTCIKNEWNDYSEYIHPLSYPSLSCIMVMHFPSAFHSFVCCIPIILSNIPR